MLIGYARSLDNRRELDAQVASLKDAGCERTFEDWGVADKSTKRPQFQKLTEFIRTGDVLVVTQLRMLGAKASGVALVLKEFAVRDIAVRSIEDGVESSPELVRALEIAASFEQPAIRPSRRQGTVGRKSKISDSQWAEIKKRLSAAETLSSIADSTGLGRGPIYSRLRREHTAEQFAEYQRRLDRGENRAAIIEDMDLFVPAVRLWENSMGRREAPGASGDHYPRE